MIKLVDQLSAMGSFPIATAQDIICSDNERLQEKIDNGSLGGSGGSNIQTITEEEYQNLTEQEKLEGDFHCYDTGNLYYKGVSYGKETDISSKQDSLSQVKFTMRRNSASEGRYCLIGSSDLSQNLLMCEPYRFQGIFGDGTTSVENKSIIDFMVSFREGVGNPDEVLSGFANSSKGFDFVDLLITTDETTNMAYAYVDFKTSGSVATGEITKPVLEAESYMDFAESFELTDTYIGTLVCKMSDYAKIITNIDDTTTSTDTVWSSKKTSDELTQKLNANNNVSMVGLGFTKGDTVHVLDFLGTLVAKFGRSGYCNMLWSNATSATVVNSAGTQSVLINGGVLYFSATNEKFPNDTWSYAEAIYYPIEGVQGKIYKFFARTADVAGVGNSGIYQYSSDGEIINDTASSTTSTYSSAKIDEKIDSTTIQTTTTTGEEYYAITYGDDFNDPANQNILIQYKRSNFAPSTYIFSAVGYATNTRETVSVAKISNNFAGSTYNLRFFVDKDNKTVYLRMPSYSSVSLQNLAFKSKAVTYTKVDAIPDTATTLAVAEYATKEELKTSSNTGVIDIVGTNYIDTSGKVNRYQVINGICYVTMEFQAFATKSIWDGVSSFFETVLPKPKVQIDIFYDGTQRLLLGNSGLIYGDITIDKRVYASFSYPIA